MEVALQAENVIAMIRRSNICSRISNNTRRAFIAEILNSALDGAFYDDKMLAGHILNFYVAAIYTTGIDETEENLLEATNLVKVTTISLNNLIKNSKARDCQYGSLLDFSKTILIISV